MKHASVLLAAIALSGTAHAATPTLTLNSPNTYEITVHSQGCFHNETSDLIIKDGVMLIDETRSQPLNEAVLNGLNLYFYALDLIPQGGCTTTTNYSIRETTPEGRVSKWNIVDSSCLRAMPGLTDQLLPKGTDWSRMVTPSQVMWASEELDLLVQGDRLPTSSSLQIKLDELLKERAEAAARLTDIMNSRHD